MLKPLQNKVLGYSPVGQGGNTPYPFDALFGKFQNILTKGCEGIDCLVLWGGTDISTHFYNEPKGKYTQHPAVHRDVDEWNALLYCKKHNIPVIGVCRGAQLGCAFAGGKLIQDINNHVGGNHDITTVDGLTFSSTSCHHQLMYPWDVPHELIAWSTDRRSNHYLNGHNLPVAQAAEMPEPEIVYFPEIRLLGIQGHPEWAPEKSQYVQYCLQLVVKHLFPSHHEISLLSPAESV